MKIGIGTAQFGSDYGISNREGMCPPDAVREILAAARDGGVRVIDTAAFYGRAEEVLGETLPRDHGFDIVTKITPRNAGGDPAAAVATKIADALGRLRQERVYAVMFHYAADLLQDDGPALWAALEARRDAGDVARIGVSARWPEEIDHLLARYPIDIIQVPFNIFDQRLLQSDHLAALKARGVEVHVRSSFLQGLLLMDPADIHVEMESARGAVERFRGYCAGEGLSPIEAALGFAAGQPEIDCVVVGATSPAQFSDILAVARRNPHVPAGAADVAVDDDTVVNPMHWPQHVIFRESGGVTVAER